MDQATLLRYSRQISLPQIDVAGQRKLLASRVLILGAGGLGQPAGLYLAGAGVGHVLIADGDAAEVANLHRQIALDEGQLGVNKARLTAERMRSINRSIRVEAVEHRLDEQRMFELLRTVDLALDASDNFASRFDLARAALRAGKPILSAAVIRAEGQVALFANDGSGPCYGCLYPPDAPVDERDESCALNGVLGPMAGLVGCLQALEAVKLLTGAGRSPQGELLVLDGWQGEWRRLQLVRDPACRLCGDLEQRQAR